MSSRPEPVAEPDPAGDWRVRASISSSIAGGLAERAHSSTSPIVPQLQPAQVGVARRGAGRRKMPTTPPAFRYAGTESLVSSLTPPHLGSHRRPGRSRRARPLGLGRSDRAASRAPGQAVWARRAGSAAHRRVARRGRGAGSWPVGDRCQANPACRSHSEKGVAFSERNSTRWPSMNSRPPMTSSQRRSCC